MPAFAEHLLFDRDKWRKIIIDQISGPISEILTDGGERGAAMAEALGLTGAFDVTNPEVQEYITNYTYKFADKICESAGESFRTIIGEGMQEGLSIRDLRDRILQDPVVGEAADKYRAEMIARTETARASEAGLERSLLNANDAARTNDQPIPFIGERWVASPDCCEFCAEMDGKESGFGEAYYEIGDSMSVEGVGSMSFTYEDVEYPPLHPNCRCTMTPIIAEDYR